MSGKKEKAKRRANRIDPLSVATSSSSAAPSSSESFPPWARRLLVVVGSAALGASCPLWPVSMQPICRAVVAAVHTLEGVPVAIDQP